MKINILFFLMFSTLYSVPTIGQKRVTLENKLYKIIINETDPVRKTVNYASLINYYLNKGQYDKEKSLSEDFYNFLEIEDLPFKEGIEELRKGNIEEKINNDYKAALEHAIQAMIFFEGLANEYPDIQMIIARVAITCASLASELGDIKDAFHYYKVANRIGKELNDLETVGMVENGLGVLYSDFGDFKGSISYFQMSLQISTEINNFQGHITSLYNLAEVYYYSNSIDSAFIFLDRTLAIHQQDTSVFSVSKLLRLKAKLLLSSGRLDEAEAHADKALEISIKLYDTYTSKLNYQLLGDIFYQRKEFDKAEISFRKAIEMEPKEANVSANSNLYFFLAKAMEAQKDYFQSQQLYKKAFKLRDSIDQTKKMRSIINFHDQIEIQKLEEQQADWLRDKKSIELDLKSRTNQLFWATTLGAIFLVMIVYIVFQVRSLKDVHQVLVRKNRELMQSQISSPTLPTIPEKEVFTGIEVVDTRDIVLLDNLFIQFEAALKKDMVFKNKDITLNKLADMMGTNRSYLSKMINQKYGKNINTLLNEYRVNTVLKSFKENQHLKYTLETLSEEAGFKSRSVFNKSFKQYTGLSPSQYLKELDK